MIILICKQCGCMDLQKSKVRFQMYCPVCKTEIHLWEAQFASVPNEVSNLNLNITEQNTTQIRVQ